METLFIAIRKDANWISAGLLILFLSWESLAPFFPFFRKQVRARIMHGARNMLLGLINALMVSIGFVGAWLWAAEWAEHHGIGLLYGLSWPEPVRVICAVCLFDFWTYWWHWANHRIPYLWAFSPGPPLRRLYGRDDGEPLSFRRDFLFVVVSYSAY